MFIAYTIVMNVLLRVSLLQYYDGEKVEDFSCLKCTFNHLYYEYYKVNLFPRVFAMEQKSIGFNKDKYWRTVYLVPYSRSDDFRDLKHVLMLLLFCWPLHTHIAIDCHISAYTIIGRHTFLSSFFLVYFKWRWRDEML